MECDIGMWKNRGPSAADEMFVCRAKSICGDLILSVAAFGGGAFGKVSGP